MRKVPPAGSTVPGARAVNQPIVMSQRAAASISDTQCFVFDCLRCKKVQPSLSFLAGGRKQRAKRCGGEAFEGASWFLQVLQPVAQPDGSVLVLAIPGTASRFWFCWSGALAGRSCRSASETRRGTRSSHSCSPHPPLRSRRRGCSLHSPLWERSERNDSTPRLQRVSEAAALVSHLASPRRLASLVVTCSQQSPDDVPQWRPGARRQEVERGAKPAKREVPPCHKVRRRLRPHIHRLIAAQSGVHRNVHAGEPEVRDRPGSLEAEPSVETQQQHRDLRVTAEVHVEEKRLN